jgi:hypothetical protein
MYYSFLPVYAKAVAGCIYRTYDRYYLGNTSGSKSEAGLVTSMVNLYTNARKTI